MATLIRCNKNSTARRSFVTAAMRPPKSLRKAVASSPRAPRVSTAIGTKQWVRLMSSYLVCFRDSASVATTPDPVTARFKWLGASVSGHVTSHTKHRPCFHGINDIPSGRLLSDLESEVGSSLDGISAVASDSLIKSFTTLCRIWRPADFRQLSPWVPDESTVAPQIHVWGAQTGAPSRVAIAIRIDVSSRRVPVAEHGNAWRNAPEKGAEAASEAGNPSLGKCGGQHSVLGDSNKRHVLCFLFADELRGLTLTWVVLGDSHKRHVPCFLFADELRGLTLTWVVKIT